MDRQKDLYDKINKKAFECGILDRKYIISHYKRFENEYVNRAPNESGKVCKEDFRL